MGVADGLGFEEVNQAQGFTDIIYGESISGTNVNATTISGTTIWGTNNYGTTHSGLTLKINNIILAGSMVGGSVFSNIEEVTMSGTNFIAGTVSGGNCYISTLTTSTTFSGTNVLGTNISGTSIYGNTIDGATFSGTTAVINSISGTNVYFSTNITALTHSGTNIVGTNISGTNLYNSQGAVRSVRQGASYGAFVQAGSGTLGGGSSWLSYPVAFASTPQFVIANCSNPVTDISQVVAVFAGSIQMGSCFITGSAADKFNWLAVGL